MDGIYHARCARHGCVSAVTSEGPHEVVVRAAGMTLTARVHLCPVHAAELPADRELAAA